MNKEKETENQNVAGAFFMVWALILIGYFMLSFLNKNQSRVENKNFNKIETEEEEIQFKSQAYQEYFKKLEELGLNTENQTDLENKLQKETVENILEKTKFTKSSLALLYVDDFYSREKYQKDVNLVLKESKEKGLGKEMDIFILQMQSRKLTENENSLKLSDSDREYFLQIANAYEYFGKQIQKLQTPKIYSGVGAALLNSSMDASIILKNMALEEDPLVGAVWFARYTEAVKIFYQSENKNQE